MSEKSESQLIREVAERYLKEELIVRLDQYIDEQLYWKESSELVTPLHYAHIIKLAEGKLSDSQHKQYRVAICGIIEQVAGPTEEYCNRNERLYFSATTTQRATALLSLEE